MKKRLIGTLLLGALFVSSTSMFVSCKDYDDDINNVSDRVTVLEAAKVDLENKIATLRADLENNYATKVALADTAHKERARALAAEAALSTRISTAQDAIDDLDALIGGDLEGNFAGMTYKQALATTWAKIESVESGLGNRITKLETDLNLDNADSKLRVYLKNLENQIAALEAWQAALNADGGAATKNYVGTEIAAAEARAAIDAATKAATAEANAKAYTDAELAAKIADALQKAAVDAQAKADAAKAAAIAAAATDATNKANAAEAAAKQYAAQEAQAKADAAEAAAKAYAKTYADQVKADAAADATTKANAAEAAAKAYADQLLVQAKTYADDKATTAENNAKAYADAQIATAKAEAIAEAARLDAIVLDNAKAYTNTEIQNLKDNELKALSDRIDALNDRLNLLDMFVKQLRSLVFIPEGYIGGVEALEVFSMNYRRYNNFATATWIADVAWNKKEVSSVKDAYNETSFDKTDTDKSRDADHPSRYNFEDGLYRVLDFTAKYHMNPSNAQLDGVKLEAPVVADKWYETRGNIGMTADGLVKPGEGTNPANSGQLWAKYKMTNPNRLATGTEITVFATKVSYKDTVITSDYATFKNKYIDSLQLAHAPKEIAPSFRGAAYKNTHCGKDPVVQTGDTYDHTNNLLYATITEAAGIGADVKDETTGFAAQDSVWYTSAGLELEKLVETHYRDVNSGKHLWMKDISAYGLHYDFELTYLVYGNNNTSESAHAVIDVKDGKHYLIPWLPTNESRNGVQSPYNRDTYETDKATYQTPQLIGRTPLVRVSLKDEAGNVLDYGYIRILITDKVENPGEPSKFRRFIEYTGPDWSYEIPWTVKNNCSPFANSSYEYATKWIETELDLYALAGVSHAEFIANWTPEYATGTAGALKQYDVISKNTTTKMAQFTALADPLGAVNEKPEASDPMTNILEWKIEGASAAADNTLPGVDAANETYHEFIAPATRPTSRAIAIRYKSNDGNEAKDIYVILNTGTLSVTEAGTISGTINWGDRKNPNYWYAINSSVERSGLNEVHANVYGVEDEKEPQTTKLWQTIAATFMGNEIVDLTSTTDRDAFITLTNGASFTGKNVALRLEFVIGAQKAFKGILTDGKEYVFVPEIVNSGMTLNVFQDKNKNGVKDAGETSQAVANLVYTTTTPADQDINHMRVEYLKTDFAKAILNYRSHNDLQDDVLTAYVAVKGKIDGCEIALNGDPINIRFLRPINVKSQDAEVEDASVNGKQVIYLRDIIALDDWRDEPFKSNYWFYYGVTDIQVVGVPAGGNLAINSDVKTNMSLDPDAEPTKLLSEVSEMVELQYNPQSWTPSLTAPAAGDFGTLTYTNLGSTVQKFTLRLPVKVIYTWGEVFTTVDVKVLCTKNNARRF